MRYHFKHAVLISFIILTFFHGVSTTQASPINFDDGGTLDGFFTFNTVTQTITDFNFQVSGGNTS